MFSWVRKHCALAAFLFYLALAALFLGPRVVADPQSRHIGGLFTDPQIFVWSLAWWPHAILHGQNPFQSSAIWAPEGFNLAWATSVPALAVVLAPVTLLAGPMVSYNVAAILAPALAAFTAFLLCRELTRSPWASLVGGYLFGFSSYVLAGELSHVNTAFVFLVPLIALVVLLFARGRIRVRSFVVLLGGMFALQLYLWTELMFTVTLALACALALAVLLIPGARPAIRRLAVPLAAAYALGAILAAPLLYYVVVGLDARPSPVHTDAFVADALNLLIPTRASVGGWWVDSIARTFPANDVERGSYLGLPTLAILVWFTIARRRNPTTRLLASLFVVASIAALGSWLTVGGHRLITLPWSRVTRLPLFDNAMPARLVMFATLAAAVIVALWVASNSAPRWVRIALPAAAVLCTLPNLAWSAWARTPDVPAVFQSDAYRDCINPGETILTLPIGAHGDSMIWQADADFRFRLTVAYISPRIPDSYAAPAVLHLTSGDNAGEVTTDAVRELAREKQIAVIVVADSDARDWRRALAPLAHGVRRDGAVIYRLAGVAKDCG
jgi:hypothetical protein